MVDEGNTKSLNDVEKLKLLIEKTDNLVDLKKIEEYIFNVIKNRV